MALRDLRASIAPAESIRAQSLTATANGTGVDLRGYDSAAILIAVGAFAGTTPTGTLQIQESDDNVTFTAVNAADLQGGALPAMDTTNDEQVLERGYIGVKRYLRVALTAIAGAGASLPIAAVVIRGHPHVKPA